LRLRTSAGHINAGLIGGDADIVTNSGRIVLGDIAGGAVVRNSNGDTTIDAVGGDVRVRAANGDIRVDRAGGGVDAKTANGSIHVGEVVRGTVVLGTAAGNLDVGIAEGTAAWLEMSTEYGLVRTDLADAPGPDEAEQTVEVRGRSAYGDITIHRS
jgi:DUF4097 and DUF4098 domain-containing protein YvlB